MNCKKRIAHIAPIFAVGFLASLLQIGCASGNQFASGAPVSFGAVPGQNPEAEQISTRPENLTPYQQNVDLDLSSATSIGSGAAITISNQGSEPVLLPGLFNTGDTALNRASILYPFRSLKDEQFALATWQFVVNHTYHYCSAGSSGDQAYLQEPLRILNGYGFACCDQSTPILLWLWQGAGYQTQIAFMEFHVVPEIYYGGAWHMFDADHRVYYLERDNQTVASVAQVIADPYLVARTADANGNDPVGFPAQWMADLYASSDPLYYNIDFTISKTFSLEPGQSLTLRYADEAPTFHGSGDLPTNTSDLIPSGQYLASSAQSDWDIDFADPNSANQVYSANNVSTVTDGSYTFLVNSTAQSASVVYRVSSPFPVLDLQVSGLVNRTDSNSFVDVFFSTDGQQWSSGFPMNSAVGTTASTAVDLTNVASGQYDYFVKVQLSGDAPYTAEIADLHITSDAQDSVFVFPTLIPGQINHLTYQDWSPDANHNIQVSLSGE